MPLLGRVIQAQMATTPAGLSVALPESSLGSVSYDADQTYLSARLFRRRMQPWCVLMFSSL